MQKRQLTCNACPAAPVQLVGPINGQTSADGLRGAYSASIQVPDAFGVRVPDHPLARPSGASPRKQRGRRGRPDRPGRGTHAGHVTARTRPEPATGNGAGFCYQQASRLIILIAPDNLCISGRLLGYQGHFAPVSCSANLCNSCATSGLIVLIAHEKNAGCPRHRTSATRQRFSGYQTIRAKNVDTFEARADGQRRETTPDNAQSLGR
jgi:hypothetical protein